MRRKKIRKKKIPLLSLNQRKEIKRQKVEDIKASYRVSKWRHKRKNSSFNDELMKLHSIHLANIFFTFLLLPVGYFFLP